MAKLNDLLNSVDFKNTRVKHFRRESWPVGSEPLEFCTVDGGKTLNAWKYDRIDGELVHSVWIMKKDDPTADDWIFSEPPVE